jgi:hypothetical protein
MPHIFWVGTRLAFATLAILAIPIDEACCAEATPNRAAARQSLVAFHSDYQTGLDEARARRKLALLWFYDPDSAAENDHFGQSVLTQPAIVALLQQHFVAIHLPADASTLSDGKKVALLDHPAFVEMHRSPGLAIIDMTDEDRPHFRQVVSVYPFTRDPISADKLAVLLDLPRGTLTQRTLIFAVRTHPESPASASGHLSQVLTRETENHAWHQASITLQGHHNWNARFQSINAELPGGLAACEVCAESWPGQGLLDAAEECVHSWRQSSGHWAAVSSHHLLFGYDMKRGQNGVWYAAGVFAGR